MSLRAVVALGLRHDQASKQNLCYIYNFLKPAAVEYPQENKPSFCTALVGCCGAMLKVSLRFFFVRSYAMSCHAMLHCNALFTFTLPCIASARTGIFPHPLSVFRETCAGWQCEPAPSSPHISLCEATCPGTKLRSLTLKCPSSHPASPHPSSDKSCP
jgi:hypothetical protein